MKNSIGNILLEKIEEVNLLNHSAEEKNLLFFRFLKYAIKDVISEKNILLTTLFSKIAYLGNRYKIDKRLLYQLQSYRKVMMGDDAEMISAYSVSKAYAVVQLFMRLIFKLEIDKTLTEEFYNLYATQFREVQAYIPTLQVLAVSSNTDNNTISAISSEDNEPLTILYDIPAKNDIYTSAINKLSEYNTYPVTLQLIEIEVDDNGDYIPSMIIIEPSYLIDATAIAQCFITHGWETRFSLINRFLPNQTSESLVLGNIANYLLDEIVSNPNIEFGDIQTKLFQMNPLSFALFDDDVVRRLLEKVRNHFDNLKRVVRIELVKNGITKENIYLEPSFLSPFYGIQGRLDLFYLNKEEKIASIVELKSGGIFRPNAYGLNNNHYTQTLLYDLLVKSTYSAKLRTNAFILYSGIETKHLRYAPSLKLQQKEALHVRNEIFMDQIGLEHVAGAMDNILEDIQPKHFEKLSGYNKTNVEYFYKTYQGLEKDEKEYLNLYISFIATEQKFAKLGINNSDRLNGLSAIWQNDVDEKKENFNILNHLEIVKNETHNDIPTLTFSRSAETAHLSNFRVGDLALLYPYQGSRRSALKSQIFKGTLLAISEDNIVLRLRSKQFNYEIFKSYTHWNIEHDSLDSGYISMYRNMFEFASRSKEVRDLWLGKKEPERRDRATIPVYEDFTKEQQQIFEEIVTSNDYYLLWGPPGTGKTSIMIKNVVKYMLQYTKEHILLLAYTNRAVDEICAAISNISDEVKRNFIRIGSRYATHADYTANLLNEKTKHISRRSELVELMQSCRIMVGTTSSVLGKHELFKLKKFDRVIVDEASQLLEPNIIGLVSRFKKCILIGDHKQLPAVVQQNTKNTEVKNESLSQLGFQNLSDSLFERLYKRCEAMGWDWVIGQLSNQGRMHEDVMAFPNEHFYDRTLTVLDKLPRQAASLEELYPVFKHIPYTDNRLVYVPTDIDISGNDFKTNIHEAQRVGRVIQDIYKLYEKNNRTIEYDSIGVITPFRAQIAMIKSTLNEMEIPHDKITIDTVERYQGGARDIIIISFCLNHVSQFRSLLSLSSEGIDRKLNVALTRAKEQIILIGNEENLSKDNTYKNLIQSYKKSLSVSSR